MNFKWIVPDRADAALQLIWIDELFFPPQDYLGELGNPAMTEEWIQAALDNDLDQSYTPRLKGLVEICRQEGIPFGVANFDFDPSLYPNAVFLIDFQNIFCQDQNKRQEYGFWYATEKNIPRERRRFYTRLEGQRDYMSAEVRVLPSNEFLPVVQGLPAVASWLAGLLLHSDSHVTDAIRFYGQAWQPGWTRPWYHNDLEQATERAVTELSKWLNADLEDPAEKVSESELAAGSAKSLMIWRQDGQPRWGTWRTDQEHRTTRALQVKVLQAVMKRIGTPVTTALARDEWIHPPCSPCFPFVVALRSVLAHMAAEQKPHTALEFKRVGDDPKVYFLSLKLTRKGPGGKDLDPWGLVKEVEDPGQNTTRQALDALRFGRTYGVKCGNSDPQKPYLDLFCKGLDYPVIALLGAPHCVHIVWTATSE